MSSNIYNSLLEIKMSINVLEQNYLFQKWFCHYIGLITFVVDGSSSSAGVWEISLVNPRLPKMFIANDQIFY
jgi:hypothetical protein